MSKGSTIMIGPQNGNYKVMVRIKPSEGNIPTTSENDEEKMLDIEGTSYLSIKDLTNKAIENKQVFTFNYIFNESSTQNDVWDQVRESVANKLIEGHNGCIMSYGQTNSGKSFTIFGEDPKLIPSSQMTKINYKIDAKTNLVGIVPRTIEYLFSRAKELEDIREFVITCSMFEIYLDQVRDLFANNQKNYPTQNMEIFENTNGQILVKNLTQVQVKSGSQLYEMIYNAFTLREKHKHKMVQVWERSHTIFNLNLVQKDKENENLPFMNATLQFIDLAGSERIAKSMTEGHSFQDAVLINSSLSALNRCLMAIGQSNTKNIPYRDSKLTRILQNCLTPFSNILLITHIYPGKNNFEECLCSLQYADRTKSLASNRNKPGAAIEDSNQSPTVNMTVGLSPFATGQANSEKMVKKLNEELSEIKNKQDYFYKEQRKKLSEIQNLLGLEMEIDKLINRPNDKEVKAYKAQKDALLEIENLKMMKNEMEYRKDKQFKQKKEIEKENAQRQEKLICTILELKEQNRRLNEHLKINQLNAKQTINTLVNEKKNEEREMEYLKTGLIEEKKYFLTHLPNEKKNNSSIGKIMTYQGEVLEKNYKSELEHYRNECEKVFQAVTEQYEYYLTKKNNEMDQLDKKTHNYVESKIEEIKQLKFELSDLNEIVQKYNKIIEKTEEGQYSGGKKSFNIDAKEKPQLPKRVSFPHLFKMLDEKHLYLTKKKENLPIEFKKSNVNSTVQQSQINYFTLNDENEAFEEEKFDFTVAIESLPLEKLKIYSRKLKSGLQKYTEKEKDLMEKVKVFETANNDIDLNLLVKEHEEFKRKYLEEVKHSKQIKATLDSQQRVINSNIRAQTNYGAFSASKTVNKFRPGTTAERKEDNSFL